MSGRLKVESVAWTREGSWEGGQRGIGESREWGGNMDRAGKERETNTKQKLPRCPASLIQVAWL